MSFESSLSQITDFDELIEYAYKSKCCLSNSDLERRDIERKVMENVYIKDMQRSQLYQRQQEEKRKKEEEEKRQREQKEEDTLTDGLFMIKIGKRGDPHRSLIRLVKEDGEYSITWQSKRKKEVSLNSSCIQPLYSSTYIRIVVLVSRYHSHSVVNFSSGCLLMLLYPLGGMRHAYKRL